MLEKTLESLLDCKEIQPVHPKGDQSWVFIGRTDFEAEIPILWHLTWRVDSLKKTLMLGGIGGRRRSGQQRMRCLDGITNSMGMRLSKLRSWWWTGRPGVLWFMGLQSQTRLSEWTELNWMPILLKAFQKIAGEGTLSDSFYEATVTLIPKSGKDNTKRKPQT